MTHVPDTALMASAKSRIAELSRQRPMDLIEPVGYGTWDGRPVILAIAMPQNVAELHSRMMEAMTGTRMPTATIGVLARLWAAQDIDPGIERNLTDILHVHLSTAGLQAIGVHCHAKGAAHLDGDLLIVETRFENLPAQLSRQVLDRATRASAQALAEDLEAPEDVGFPVGTRWVMQGVMLNSEISGLLKEQQKHQEGDPSDLLLPGGGRAFRDLADRHGAHGPEP